MMSKRVGKTVFAFLITRYSSLITSSPSGLFSVALSVGLLRLDVIKHRALGSSDFPHPSHRYDGPGAITTTAATSGSIAQLRVGR